MEMVEMCGMFNVVATTMPVDDFSMDDPEIRFVQAGCEVILKDLGSLGPKAVVTEQGPNECDFGEWDCDFRVDGDTDTIYRLVVVHTDDTVGIGIQATVSEWDTCSTIHSLGDVTELDASLPVVKAEAVKASL